MFLARVVGTVVATRKDPGLAGTKLLVIAFVPGGAFGVSGIDPAEMERRFTSGWTMLSAGHEPGLDNDSEKGLARFYLFERHT